MGMAGIVRNEGRGRRRRRGEGAQTTHLRDAARLAGEAFGCDEDGPGRATGAASAWNAAAATLVAAAMLFL